MVFGHSVGGGIAAQAGAACLAVISESAQAFVEERTLQGIRAAKAAFASDAQHARLQRWHGDKADWVLAAWTETWLDQQFRDWSLDAVLPKVDCPVLVIHGDRDEFGSSLFPERIAQGVAGPARQRLLHDCGHVPHREREAEVLRLVAEFLADDRFKD